MSTSLVNIELAEPNLQAQGVSRRPVRKQQSTRQSSKPNKVCRVSRVRVRPSVHGLNRPAAIINPTRKSAKVDVPTTSLAMNDVQPSENQRQVVKCSSLVLSSDGHNRSFQRRVSTQLLITTSASAISEVKTTKRRPDRGRARSSGRQVKSNISTTIINDREQNSARHRKRRRVGPLHRCSPACCLTTTLLATLAILALGAGLAVLLLLPEPKSTSKAAIGPTSTSTDTTTTIPTSTSTSTITSSLTTSQTSTITTSISSTSSTTDTSTTVSTTTFTTTPIVTSTTQTATTSSSSTSTTTACGIAATACTSCTSACSSGLLLTLNQSSASAWGNGGSGFTQYQYTWLSPSTTSATITFQFFTTRSGNYWDLDDVSVKDSSGAEKITNGGFAIKSSWSESCSISACASIENYGPGSTKNYWVNCISTSNYYRVSQTFPVMPCAWYNISFIMARFKGTTDTANAYVYIT